MKIKKKGFVSTKHIVSRLYRASYDFGGSLERGS